MNISTVIKTVVAIVFLLGVFTLGFYAPHSATQIVTPRQIILQNNQEEKYSLINKAVVTNIGKHFIINFRPLKAELEKIKARHPQHTYLYFSYLNNGSWIGLGEREEFTAASTLKVPIAMALMKAVEDGKVKLSDSYSLDELDLDAHFGDLYKAGSDKEFTIEELMRIMLEQSDNTALNALSRVFQRIGVEDPLGGVYGFLGWEFTPVLPEFGQAPDYSKINLKTLSNLFIALYDAKYVSIEHSNQILEYLSRTPFDNQIAAGVPKDIVVSHKIGVSDNDKTFSDCGIVYAPNRNYLLCLGSNGGEEAKANAFMAEASKAVYDYVINN